MDVKSDVLTFYAGLLLVICYCEGQDVLKVKSLTSVKFDHPDTPHMEYICMGALEINFVNENELLLGVCTPPIEDLSAAIGTLAISELEKKETTGANLLYGSLNMPEPKGSDPNWDGTGVNARIKRPEQLYQTKDAIRFIDDRSCARKIDRATGKVTTVLGECARNTLDIPGAELRACYGMTYFEDKEMWVFSVVNDGLYVYKEGSSSPRLVLHEASLSQLDGSYAMRLQRGRDCYGERNDLVWNKVSSGLNYYNMADVNSYSGNITYGVNFVRYISATGDGSIDTSARRHNQTDPVIGSWQADLAVSPNGKIMAIGDTKQDRLFFLDIPDNENYLGRIKPLQAVCIKKSGVFENRLDNCTFSSISAAGWANPTTFVAYEQKLGAFRKFTVVLPAIPTTRVITTASTTASTRASTTSTTTKPTDNPTTNITVALQAKLATITVVLPSTPTTTVRKTTPITTASTTTSTTSSTKATKATDMPTDHPTTNNVTASAEALRATGQNLGAVFGCLAFLVLAAICIALARHRHKLMSRRRERTTAKAQSNIPIPEEDQLGNASVVNSTPTVSAMVSKDLDTVPETQPIKMMEKEKKDKKNKKKNKSKVPSSRQESKSSVFEDPPEKF